MDSTTIQNAGIIFSIVLGIVSLVLGVLQARISAEQVKSVTSGTMFGYLMQLNQVCLDNPDIELTKLGGNEYGAMDPQDRKAQIMIDIHLTFIEEIFYQHERFANYTEGQWETWEKMLISMGRSAYVRNYWIIMKPNFDPDFIKAVDVAFSKSLALETLQTT